MNRAIRRVAATGLLRQAGIYTASNLLSRALPFLLLPVLTRFLTPADYGLVAMFVLTATVIEPFVGLSLAGAVSVKFYDRHVDLPLYIGTGLVMVAFVALPVLLLVLAFGEPLARATRLPIEWLLLAVCVVGLRTIGSVFLALLRVLERALLYAVAQNLQTLAAVLLTLALVVGLGMDWRGRVGAEAMVTLGLALVGLVWLSRSGWQRLRFDPQYARNIGAFGIPLIPHALGGVLILQTDRLLLTNLVGVEETGLYTVGYQLALVIELVALSFNYAYAPWLLTQLAEADERVPPRLVRITYLQFVVMAAFAASVALFMPWFSGVFLGSRFAASAQYVGWFALGFLFSAMYYMVTNYIFFAERTRWLAAVTISVAAVHIPLTYALIRVNGGVGASQAMAISMGLSFALTWVVSNHVYPMPWLGGPNKLRPRP